MCVEFVRIYSDLFPVEKVQFKDDVDVVLMNNKQVFKILSLVQTHSLTHFRGHDENMMH